MKIQLVPNELTAKIKVLGIGGAGGNAINDMIASQMVGVDFIAANTDAQALERSLAPVKIQLGPDVTRGLGAGGDPTWAVRPPRRRASTSSRSSRAPTWCSLPRAWAAAPVPAAPRGGRPQPGIGGPHRGRGEQTLRIRGQDEAAPGRQRHRGAAQGGGHHHHHPQ